MLSIKLIELNKLKVELIVVFFLLKLLFESLTIANVLVNLLYEEFIMVKRFKLILTMITIYD